MKLKDGKTVTLDVIEHFIESDDHRGDPNAPVVYILYFIYRELQEIRAILRESKEGNYAIKDPEAKDSKEKSAVSVAGGTDAEASAAGKISKPIKNMGENKKGSGGKVKS